MTRVFLDARSITAEPAGVARYAQSLVARLIALRPQWDWVILRHASNREPLVAHDVAETYSDIPIDSMANHLFGAQAVRAAIRRHGAPDVYHSLFQVVPRGLPRALRVVVTAHDFIDMDHPGAVRSNRAGAARLGAYANVAFPHAMRRADRVIAISEHTAARARQLTDPGKIVVIGHGVEPRFFEQPPETGPIVRFLVADGWRNIVAIGNDKPYKNLASLIRAFAHADLPTTRLVLVGRCDGLRPLSDALGLGDRTAFLGFLGDEDLRRVLGHADLFVFPSTLEGFGMPPLEAMAMGVPTAVSDLEPMRTVAGDAAMRFAPYDVYALAEILRRVLGDSALHASLSRAGRAWAARWSWDAAAQASYECCENWEPISRTRPPRGARRSRRSASLTPP